MDVVEAACTPQDVPSRGRRVEAGGRGQRGSAKESPKMLLKVVLGVVLGGGIGLAIGYAGKSMGGQCPIACNPYVSTGLGVFIGLLLASRSGGAGALIESPNVLKLTSAEQYRQAVNDPDKAVLVEFYTDGCPWCAKQMPVINRIADRLAGSLLVATADARQVRTIVAQEKIEGFPTMLLLKGGRVVERIVGYKDSDELMALLKSHLPARDTGDAGRA
jgi:thioredoxin 1